LAHLASGRKRDISGVWIYASWKNVGRRGTQRPSRPPGTGAFRGDEIDEHGQRHLCRPQEHLLRRDGVPQLADAKPWERFRSREEWEGAMKLSEYWLTRLGGPDKEYVFTLLADTVASRCDPFDFREQL
jgi:hypothetical protein